MNELLDIVANILADHERRRVESYWTAVIVIAAVLEWQRQHSIGDDDD